MKALSKRRSKGLHIAVVCVLAVALGSMWPARRSRAQGPTTYTLIDLGAQNKTSKAFGINNCGRVTGEYDEKPAFWKIDGLTVSRTDIGTFGGGGTGRAYAANSSNFVVGHSLTSGQQSFIWHDNDDDGISDAGELISLGALTAGGASDAYHINDSGTVVGIAELDTNGFVGAFLWDKNLGIRALSPANGFDPFYALEITASGHITGDGDNALGQSYAYIFNGSSFLDLGTLGGAARSRGEAIENVGGTDYVVGVLLFDTPTATHAFVWQNGSMQDIHAFGGTNSHAYDVNSNGQVVGSVDVAGTSHAFLWQGGMMSDLNDLDDKPSSWIIQEAQSINDAGEIAGFGINPGDPTHVHAFLLRPSGFTSTPCSLAPTTVSAVSGTGVFNSTATLTATLKSLAGAVSGKTIIFTVDGAAVCGGALPACPTTNASGVATFNVSGYGGGAHPINASFAGDAVYAASNAAGTLNVSKINQTITFNALTDKTFGDADFTVSATASSNLSVSFAASGQCTMANANTVHLTGAGGCTITASQAGDTNYNAATSVPRSFTIGAANQTITFGSLANKTFGDADFVVSATASSGLPVSFAATSGQCTMVNANTVHITGAGSCTITASQSGDNNYNAATNVPRSFSISKANQTINFGTLSNKFLGDADFSVSATATSGLTVSFAANGQCTVSGSTVHITGLGNCTITASQAGDSNYNAATDVQQQFSIGNPPPVLVLEEGSTTVLAALDSVTFVRGPFRLMNDHNFSIDHHTRIIFFTSNLGTTQPAAITVQAGGIPLTVEAVGPLTGIPGFNASYVVVRLEDGLPTGDVQLTVTLQGVTSTAAVITIAP